MKKLLIFAIVLLVSSQKIFAQTAKLDSIFMMDSVIIANVKEITPDLVKYNVPEMEVTTSIYKNTVRKIHFNTGQTQVFKEYLSLENIKNAYEFDKVKVCSNENETRGLIKIGAFYAGYYGWKNFNYKDFRDYAKTSLKIQSAMSGGNIVFVPDVDSSPHLITGSVYTNTIPKIEKFKAFIGDKKEFKVFRSISVSWYGNNIEDDEEFPQKVIIDDIYEENNFIYIKSKKSRGSENQVYRLVSFDEDNITLTLNQYSRIYNLILFSK